MIFNEKSFLDIKKIEYLVSKHRIIDSKNSQSNSFISKIIFISKNRILDIKKNRAYLFIKNLDCCFYIKN